MAEDDREHEGPNAEGTTGEETVPEAEAEPPEGAGQEPAAPTWFHTATTTTCPACGAAGAMMLGEGIFCPTCGEVTTPRQQSG